MTNDSKRVIIIIIYRLLQSEIVEVYCTLTQYNCIEVKVKLVAGYCKEVFEECLAYVKITNDIDDIIKVGNINQNIASNKV